MVDESPRAPSVHTVLSDGYDRERFGEALRREPALAGAVERAGRLLPHAEPLLCDLFAALFKMNVVLRDEADLSAAVLVNRRLVAAVTRSGALGGLRTRTVLDEVQSGAAAAVLAEHVLAALTRDFRVLADELAEIAEAAHDEESLSRLESELRHLDEIEEGPWGDEGEERLRQILASEIDELRRRLETARARQRELAESLSREIDSEVDLKTGKLEQDLEEIGQLAHSLGLGSGRPDAAGARAALELGTKLLASRKLQLLARLVGAFRDVANEARRRRVSRAPQELHAVTRGRDLFRLLPSELVGLDRRRRWLHLELLRRFAEGELLVHELDAAAERGPMVVCVDGSGSMRGSKELWAKAVALTLMDIARRQHRRCLALVFSSGSDLFEVELVEGRRASLRGARGGVRDAAVLRFAEHFPGGGTSFEEPLERAVAAVTEGRYRRGDVIFVTDGEARVSAELVARIRRARRRHRFRIRGVLVDTGESRSATLELFCDDVRRVTDLTADSMADLFSSV